MKLYQYHHCPFCVRADMVANYKQVEHQKVYLANDDDDTCLRLVNAKMVPILEFDDGRAMPESMDIARTLDLMGNPEKIMRPATDASAVETLIASVRPHTLALLFPRDVAIGLPEFETRSARDYFRRKKEALLGCTFEQALEDTGLHKTEVENMLARLPTMVRPADHGQQLGWDDVMIYPVLRNLTMVYGLGFPEHIRDWLQEISDLTGTSLYFDRAM